MESNVYQATQKRIKHAVEQLGLSLNVYESLKSPDRLIESSLPVKMDDGSIRSFTAFRAQHSNVLGPYKGGIRYHTDVNANEIKAMSIWMTLKCAIARVPYGGGKGGVICNPENLSSKELERISRQYIRAMSPVLGPEKDIPAPDVNTNAQVMAWMTDEYCRIRGFNDLGIVTGKPLDMGGCVGRETATGRGVFYAVQQAAKMINLPLKDAVVAVQGYGNVGYYAALFLWEKGCKIVAVTDSTGGAYDEKGLNPKELYEHKKQTGSVKRYKNSSNINSAELFTLNCDIIVPAALGNQITADIAKNIKAKIIGEGANGPITPEADEILKEKNILVVPDVLASSGGVIVSYFEWVQNNYSFYWPSEEIEKQLEQKIVEAFTYLYNYSASWENKITIREAAFMYAIKRLADIMKIRGWIV